MYFKAPLALSFPSSDDRDFSFLYFFAAPAAAGEILSEIPIAYIHKTYVCVCVCFLIKEGAQATKKQQQSRGRYRESPLTLYTEQRKVSMKKLFKGCILEIEKTSLCCTYS